MAMSIICAIVYGGVAIMAVSGDKTVFEAVEVGFDGVCWIPRGTKKCVVGLLFRRS